jgi:hypothetical protein
MGGSTPEAYVVVQRPIRRAVPGSVIAATPLGLHTLKEIAGHLHAAPFIYTLF